MIREERRWSAETVRNYCIRHNFYTAGNNIEYGRMLRNVDSRHPNTSNIKITAEDIMAHSTEQALDGRDLTNIMFSLFREAVYVFFAEVDEIEAPAEGTGNEESAES